MPLRAKIQNASFLKAQMATAAPTRKSSKIKELPGDDPEDVLFDSLYGVRTIELNRPKKLNSLNGSMIRKIVPRLQEWLKSDMANVVVMKGAGEKAFCAGGDVAALAQQNLKSADGAQKSADYFGLEYKLDHLIATYEKPYVAFMDGITMGGGVGLSIHAPLRIATERTVFAMPETTIGFFPDVGASFFLSRMPGGVGTYLALTSNRLTGVNVFYSGIATHYIHSTTLPALESRLAELRFRDNDSIAKRLTIINSTIEEFSTGLPHDVPIEIAGELRAAIDRCFTLDTVPEIIKALEKEATTALEAGNESLSTWAQETLATIRQRSPTSVYTTLKLLRLGRNWSIKDAFEREHALASKFMKLSDFNEGVSARLIDKPARQPKWEPATLEDLAGKEDPAIELLRTDGIERIELLSNSDFKTYPWADFSLPSEKAVHEAVTSARLSHNGVLERFIQATGGKQGVTEVVAEILKRKTKANEFGTLEWIQSKPAVEAQSAKKAEAAPETQEK